MTTNPCPSLSAIKGVTPQEFYDRCSRSGRHTIMVWVTGRKARREHPGTYLTKRVRAVGITGDAYAEIPEVKAAVKKGLRPEPGPLPWGEWVPGMFPYVIQHPDKNGVMQYYGRVYLDDDHITNNTYWVDDAEVTGEVFRTYLPDGAAKPRVREVGKPICLSIPLTHFEEVA